MLLLVAINEYGHELSDIGRNRGGRVDGTEISSAVKRELNILGARAGAQQKNR
jgi:hypothetical protein